MKRGWQPGDVALVQIGDLPPEVAVSSGKQWFVAGPRYGNQRGWHHDDVKVVRPLTVIDPEDREQVERLAQRLHSRQVGDGGLAPWDSQFPSWRSDRIDAMQAALREYADPTPPKPEEPTGLGAVVEDAEGVWWVHFESVTGSWWRRRDGGNARYADINVVRVLSEGVTEGADR